MEECEYLIKDNKCSISLIDLIPDDECHPQSLTCRIRKQAHEGVKDGQI
jgi:hypothetical protein